PLPTNRKARLRRATTTSPNDFNQCITCNFSRWAKPDTSTTYTPEARSETSILAELPSGKACCLTILPDRSRMRMVSVSVCAFGERSAHWYLYIPTSLPKLSHAPDPA
ncbi:MAG: hypothetical protein AAFO91_13200, partial [Bacteroidota bacterium]